MVDGGGVIREVKEVRELKELKEVREDVERRFSIACGEEGIIAVGRVGGGIFGGGD